MVPSTHRLYCDPVWPPEDKDAIASVGSLFARPASVPQLLQNLRLAYEKKLLLLPAFYDKGNLLKFFGSDHVTPRGSLQPLLRGATGIVIDLAASDGVLARMTARLKLSCWPKPEYKPGSVVVPAHLQRAGSVYVSAVTIPNLTVNAVRAMTTKVGAEITFRINLSLAGRGPEYANEPLFTGDDAVDSVEIYESGDQV